MKTVQLLITMEIPDNADISTGIKANGEEINVLYCSDVANPSVIFIVWRIGDFESRALEIEARNDPDFDDEVDMYDSEAPKPKPMFDRSKFSEALGQMNRHHDANLGITWDTIDYYLNEYCKINNFENKVQELESLYNDLESVTWDEDEKTEFITACNALLTAIENDGNDQQLIERIKKML
jgi:hypothetical protein